MSALEIAYANGQLAALARYKRAWLAPTHPVVRESPLLNSKATAPTAPSVPVLDAPALAQNFNAQEQVKTRTEPHRKLSAESMCTSCRKEKHYGTCKNPITIKRSNFNQGMTADDAVGSNRPATSNNYSSATSAVSADSRANDGRPAGEQATTAFADLFRHLGISEMPDEPDRMYGALDKVSTLIRTKLRDDGDNNTFERMWHSFDNVSDSTCVDGGAGTPTGEPAA